MEIASIMLLATASVVLLCTFVRCCCRNFCHREPTPPSEIHLDEATELSDASDDDVPTRTDAATFAAAAKRTAPARDTSSTRSDGHGDRSEKPVAAAVDDDEDDLPGYAQVVDDDGPQFSVQPLSAAQINRLQDPAAGGASIN